EPQGQGQGRGHRAAHEGGRLPFARSGRRGRDPRRRLRGHGARPGTGRRPGSGVQGDGASAGRAAGGPAPRPPGACGRDRGRRRPRRRTGTGTGTRPEAYSPCFGTAASVVIRSCTSSLTLGANMPRLKSVRLIVATASKPAAGWPVMGLLPTLFTVVSSTTG